MMKKLTLLWFFLVTFYSNLSAKQLNDSINVLVPLGHKYVIETIAWSMSGRHFATGSNHGFIKIWDAKSSGIIHTLGESKLDGVGIGSLCFTPDGKYLLSSLLGIDIWDVSNGKHVKKLDAFTGAYIYSIDISPNSKTVLVASGSIPSLWDIELGKKLMEYKHPGIVQCVKFTKDATQFLTGCADGVVRLHSATSKEVIKEFKFSDKNIVAVDFSFDEKTIVLADKEMIYVCDTNSGKLIKSFAGHPRRHRAVGFTLDDDCLLVSEFGNLRKIDINSGKSTVILSYDGFNEVAFSKDRRRALYSIEGTDLLHGATDTRLIDLESGKTIKEFKSHFVPINEVKFSSDNRTLATIVNRCQIKLFNLSNINDPRIINGSQIYTLSFSPNGKMLAYGHGSMSKKFVTVVDPFSLRNILTFPVGEMVSSISFSGDNELLAIGEPSGKVQIMSIAKGESIYSFKAISDFPTRIDFSLDNEFLLVTTPRSNEQHNIREWRREWYYPQDRPLNEQKFPKVKMNKWALDARTMLKLCDGDPGIFGEQISFDGETIYKYRDKSYFEKIDVQSGSSKRCCYGHQGAIRSLTVSNNNKLVASTADDNTLRIWDNTTGKTLVSYFAIDSLDWFWITPDNYYYSSKNASRVVNFKKSNQIYRFHQFDLQLNRPDLVMKNIGLSSDSLISFYHQLIQKRFREMGVKKDSVISNFSVPVISIVNFDSIPDITAKAAISLNIKATSPDEDLKKINIWINGVPIFKTLLEKNKTVSGKIFQTKYNIPLIEGKNVIEVSCSNQSERESLIESVLVNYDPAVKHKPDLYIVAIGVSEYKKYPQARLKFADKDATDLVKKFSTSELFNKVYADTLTNGVANRDNLLKIKKMLMKARENDLVILSFSGHGISYKNEFYFCTSNIDLDSIAATAVSFSEMENLLDSTPAYKKMLLIDACYSGEVDKEAAEEIIRKGDATKALQIGDAKTLIPGNALKSGQQNTFELIKESFIDLRRRTGTTVIASSSGVDISYEKDKWKNGLFTYAVLSALNNTQDADLNGDGIYVSELIPYILKSVKDLSLGLQKPTIREENIDFDFRIW